jgi:hypothetical protein
MAIPETHQYDGSLWRQATEVYVGAGGTTWRRIHNYWGWFFANWEPLFTEQAWDGTAKQLTKTIVGGVSPNIGIRFLDTGVTEKDPGAGWTPDAALKWKLDTRTSVTDYEVKWDSVSNDRPWIAGVSEGSFWSPMSLFSLEMQGGSGLSGTYNNIADISIRSKGQSNSVIVTRFTMKMTDAA